MMTTAKTITSAAAPLRVRAIIRLAAAITCAGIAAAAAGCGSAPAGASRRQQTGARLPQQTATGFLAAYARPDGRVVRPDQGGDTVSEGQAYGMLLAETAGNYDALARIWEWARDTCNSAMACSLGTPTRPAGSSASSPPATRTCSSRGPCCGITAPVQPPGTEMAAASPTRSWPAR